MRKPGKPNSFLKGMQMDVDPLLQPKDSYRYAKNIRLASYVGKNISVQPYDSDKLALALAGGEISTFETGTISDIVNWTAVSETIYTNWSQLTWQSFFTALTNASIGLDFEQYFTYGTLSDNYDTTGSPSSSYVFIGEYVTPGEWFDDVTVESEVGGQLLPPFGVGGFYITFYEQFLLDYTSLPLTTIASGVGDSNSDGIGLTFTVTLTLSNADIEVIDVEVPPFAEISDATSTPLYFENIIANQITLADNSLTAAVTTSSGGNNLWTFSSSNENTVTNVNIEVNGTIVVTTNIDNEAIEYHWQNAFSEYLSDSDYANSGIVEDFIGVEFAAYFSDRINWYVSTISGVNGTFDIEDFQLLNEDADIESGYSVENLYLSKGMQILGHYAFSDYLVILGTWIEQEGITGYPSDFVLKTSQKKDGTLVNVGEEGIYELFFLGNLGFSNKKKLKVVGAEENEHVRRIYFTDGDIPLRTMNVGADPSIYSQYTDDPGYFDLFIETKVSVPKVTGFVDGGALESIGHSYAFRYKTLDGRMSRISPVSNPASLPVSGSSNPAPFTQGGNPGKNTSKSIKGIIENLDTRYPYVEMIHIPYIGGAPGVAQVFATIPLPAGETTLKWTHTGTEIIREEIIALEFGADYISWDSCKALEVKDNRLFVGNLKGVAESVDTDFTVVSYNSWNQPHSYEGGNPDLYNDLLYSQAGVSYDANGESPDYHGPQSEDYGKYTKPNGDDFHRYIKGPVDEEGEQNGLYTSSLSAPEYWSAENTAPVPYEVKRGIFGAESKHFRTPLDNGEYEGVRVTFRILGSESGDDRPVELDNDDKLISTGSEIAARAPFYRVDKNQDTGGYYANYANPMYNSNYVGYRRGEIYRFGLLFYDKKGSPMFVKRIGDIRMPEHSTEYISPTFAGSTVSGFDLKWPYYYQTSRSNLDGGFVDWPNFTWDSENYVKPYSNHDMGKGQKGCVLYPYFEVKLSSETCSKISGYSIVRVERTPQNRTISTSGILQRAVKYCDNSPNTVWNDNSQDDSEVGDLEWKGANRCGMDGRYGNYHNSIFTPTIQDYCSHIYGQSAVDFDATSSTQVYTVGAFKTKFGADTPVIGGEKDWSHSNIFTMDSPDAIINGDFNLNFGSGDRIKITEQRYCIKQSLKNGGYLNNRWPHFFNSYLSDGYYGGLAGASRPDMYLGPQYVSLFACQIDPELLKGEDIYYYQEETTTADAELTVQNFGGWKHKLSPNNKWSTDWEVDFWTFDLLWRRFTGYEPNGGNLTDAINEGLSDDEAFVDTDDEPTIYGDGPLEGDVHLGIYTKYYSKRIGAYPMYGMARPDWNKYDYGQVGEARTFNTQGGGGAGDDGGEGFGMNVRDWKFYAAERWMTPCFTGVASWQATSDNPYSNEIETTNTSTFVNTNLSLSGDEHYLWYLNGERQWDFYNKYNDWGGVRATNVIPDILANASWTGPTNSPGERIDSYTTSSNKLDPYWRESNIYHAQVVSPGQEVSESTLGSDRPYRNATMWHDPHRQNLPFSLNSTSKNMRNHSLGGNTGGTSSDISEETTTYSESRADFCLSHKTIVMSLPHHAMLPITRHCLDANNWRERVFYQFGGPNILGYWNNDHMDQDEWQTNVIGSGYRWACAADHEAWGDLGISGMPQSGASGATQFGKTGRGSTRSVDSPEVTMASIVKNHNANTLYGGNTSLAFAKNTFVSTGSFRQVNQVTAYDGSGNNGLAVFGGDTFIANFSLKKVHNPDTDAEYSDRGVLTAYTCPVETETNLDLRHGYFFGSDTQNIAKQIPDDTGSYAYNTSYDAENKIQIFSPKPFGFVEIDHWPSTVAFSEPKMTGDTVDNYSIFPVNQIKDLDYTKGPIRQMFKLQNKLFALQDSGTCQLAVNPRVMIPAGEGGAIQAVTGTDNVIERYDYVSSSLGTQHFHGLAVTDRAAYYYDDNASKFLQLGVGKGGGFGVTSLGDSAGMQTFFQQYSNQIIYDKPLMSPNINYPAVSEGQYVNDLSAYDSILNEWGGINIGYDPEFSEVLLSVSNKNPYTLVYNENLGVFTSFISKRPSNYINFKNRLYCTYDTFDFDEGTLSNTMLYLSNGHINENIDEGYRYLTFGDVDYYILGHGIDESYSYDVDTYTNYVFTEDYPTLEDNLERWGVKSDLLSKEPVQIHFVLNDEPMQPKIFDNIDIYINTQSDVGAMHLYFRKFTFLGSANRGAYTEYDASEFTGVDQIYSSSESSFFQDPGQKMWYSVKDGTHHIPLRTTGAGAQIDNSEPAVRGTYAIVAAAIGWDEGDKFFGVEGGDKIMKNEGFSILSLVPYYRYSRR
tara:strand:+ start:1884 stop:8798 length:6915 start_codon:yes stop_codon:yes gene_type:complete